MRHAAVEPMPCGSGASPANQPAAAMAVGTVRGSPAGRSEIVACAAAARILPLARSARSSDAASAGSASVPPMSSLAVPLPAIGAPKIGASGPRSVSSARTLAPIRSPLRANEPLAETRAAALAMSSRSTEMSCVPSATAPSMRTPPAASARKSGGRMLATCALAASSIRRGSSPEIVTVPLALASDPAASDRSPRQWSSGPDPEMTTASGSLSWRPSRPASTVPVGSLTWPWSASVAPSKARWRASSPGVPSLRWSARSASAAPPPAAPLALAASVIAWPSTGAPSASLSIRALSIRTGSGGWRNACQSMPPAALPWRANSMPRAATCRITSRPATRSHAEMSMLAPSMVRRGPFLSAITTDAIGKIERHAAADAAHRRRFAVVREHPARRSGEPASAALGLEPAVSQRDEREHGQNRAAHDLRRRLRHAQNA